MTTICFCISCFPKMGTPPSGKSPWCHIQKKEEKNIPALLNDLPDDLLLHIRSMLKKMVKQEQPYKLPICLVSSPFNLKPTQWERQKQAIALTTKEGVLTWDKKKHICHKKIWRCEECFAETAETTLCFKCSDKLKKEEEYYFETPLSILFGCTF
jgi:hypothetical protein